MPGTALLFGFSATLSRCMSLQGPSADRFHTSQSAVYSRQYRSCFICLALNHAWCEIPSGGSRAVWRGTTLRSSLVPMGSCEEISGSNSRWGHA